MKRICAITEWAKSYWASLDATGKWQVVAYVFAGLSFVLLLFLMF